MKDVAMRCSGIAVTQLAPGMGTVQDTWCQTEQRHSRNPQDATRKGQRVSGSRGVLAHGMSLSEISHHSLASPCAGRSKLPTPVLLPAGGLCVPEIISSSCSPPPSHIGCCHPHLPGSRSHGVVTGATPSPAAGTRNRLCQTICLAQKPQPCLPHAWFQD